MTKDEALKLALEALEEITLAGMSGSGQESEEAMTAWHARQAWKFIGIAARALDPIKQALAAPVQDSTCSETLRAQGKAYPRTCRKCGLGPCIGAPKQPPAVPAPPECQTEAEKTAFAFGWWKALESVRQPAVPDAFGTREGEHPQYVQGWNDCRAEMLGGVKP
jgi:nitroreductase